MNYMLLVILAAIQLITSNVWSWPGMSKQFCESVPNNTLQKCPTFRKLNPILFQRNNKKVYKNSELPTASKVVTNSFLQWDTASSTAGQIPNTVFYKKEERNPRFNSSLQKKKGGREKKRKAQNATLVTESISNNETTKLSTA
uniref:Putative secreted protein n=1 Tax=Ixodes ricinus TaxID=34613 RepID=A0A090XES2_IXORI